MGNIFSPNINEVMHIYYYEATVYAEFMDQFLAFCVLKIMIKTTNDLNNSY